MREYGRWIKNIAAFFLLMALLSLLLPFCRFQAAGKSGIIRNGSAGNGRQSRDYICQT